MVGGSSNGILVLWSFGCDYTCQLFENLPHSSPQKRTQSTGYPQALEHLRLCSSLSPSFSHAQQLYATEQAPSLELAKALDVRTSITVSISNLAHACGTP